jgi:hypothetical protein
MEPAEGSKKESTQPQTEAEVVGRIGVLPSTKWKWILLLIRQAWNWKPPPARYDADNPPKFTIWLNLLFGFVFHHPPSTSSPRLST